MGKLNQEVYKDVNAITEEHLATILLLDRSGSMKGKPCEELQDGFNSFITQTSSDELAMKRVDLAVVSFGNNEVTVEKDWMPLASATEEAQINLNCAGNTPMGTAIEKAIAMSRERLAFYDSFGIQHYKPWIFMITDGYPTDNVDKARELIKQREGLGRLKFFAVSVNGADTNFLKSISHRVIECTSENNFKGIFNWLSESMIVVSASHVNENPQLPDLPKNTQAVPSDW